jgi:hypothetical protein
MSFTITETHENEYEYKLEEDIEVQLIGNSVSEDDEN